MGTGRVSPTNGFNGWGWTRPKLGVQNSIQVLHVGGVGPSSTALLNVLARRWVGSEASRTQTSPQMVCWHCMWWLFHCTTATNLRRSTFHGVKEC